MRDWIVGLQKAATDSGAGAAAAAIGAAEAKLGAPLPEALRELYGALDGARFAADVRLFPLEGEGAASVVGASRSPLPGLELEGLVRFGERGSGEHLFAGRRGALERFPKTPSWLAKEPPDGWLYGIWTSYTGELTLYRSLERMIWLLIPPAETEDFGENTYVRAMALVQGALEEISSPGENEPPSDVRARARETIAEVRESLERPPETGPDTGPETGKD